MAISYQGTGTPGTTTTTLPTHQAGDLILIASFRDGNPNAPTLPAGYTSIQTVQLNNIGARLGYKIAASGAETSGTWTNGTATVCAVYRASAGVISIGGSGAASVVTDPLFYPQILNYINSDSSSWIALFGAHRSINTTIEVAPSDAHTSFTNRVDYLDAVNEAVVHDSNGAADMAFYNGINQNVGGTSSGSAAFAVEIAEIFGTSSLIDPFDQYSASSTRWSVDQGSNTVIFDLTGATATLQTNTTSADKAGVVSNAVTNLTGNGAYIQVLTIPNPAKFGDAELRLYIDANNWLRWVEENGTLYAQYMVAGVKSTPFSVAYSAVTHLYWRIRESGGSILWDTSVDGSAWTNRATVANPIVVTRLYTYIKIVGTTTETSPGSFKWNNLNIVATSHNYNRPLSQSIASSEARVKSMGTPKADSAASSDSITKSPLLPKADSVTVSDGIVKTIGKGINDPVIPSDGRTNLLVNPSFESPGTWTLGGTTGNITLQSTDVTPQDGTYEAKVIEVSGNCYLYQDVTVQPNTQYTLSAYVQITNWSAGGMFLKATDTSFNGIATVASAQSNLGWTRLNASFTTGPGVTTVRVVLDTFNNATLTGYWDAVMIEQGAALNPFISGSLANLIKTIGVNKSDTPTPVDSRTTANSFVRSLSDTATVSDVASKRPAKYPADVITTSDGISVTTGRNKGLADSVTISDTRITTVSKSIADTITVVESNDAGKSIKPADTVTPSDASSRSVTKVIADSVGATDVITRSGIKPKTDSVSTSDGISRRITHVITDSVGTSEHLSALQLLRDTLIASDKFYLFLNGIAFIVPTTDYKTKPRTNVHSTVPSIRPKSGVKIRMRIRSNRPGMF